MICKFFIRRQPAHEQRIVFGVGDLDPITGAVVIDYPLSGYYDANRSFVLSGDFHDEAAALRPMATWAWGPYETELVDERAVTKRAEEQPRFLTIAPELRRRVAVSMMQGYDWMGDYKVIQLTSALMLTNPHIYGWPDFPRLGERTVGRVMSLMVELPKHLKAA